MANNPSVTLTFAGDSKQVVRSTNEVGTATDTLREKVDKNSTSMARDTETSTERIRQAHNKQQREYNQTANSFEDMVTRMIREKRRLDLLNKSAAELGVMEHPVFGIVYKRPAQEAGEDAGDQFVNGFSSRVPAGIKSFFSSPGAIISIAALPGLFGPIGLAAGGAVVLGFGAALSGIGMIVASKSPEVLAHFERLKINVQAKMMQISAPFRQTMIDIATTAQRAFNSIVPELDKTFPQAAKDISEFVFNLGDAFKQLAPVIGPIMEAFGKILDSLGPQLPGVFQNIANALIPLADAVARNADGFSSIVVFFLNLIPLAINLITAMIEFGEWWGKVWRGIGDAISTVYSSTIKPIFDGIKIFADGVSTFVSTVFTRMGESVMSNFRQVLSGVRTWPEAIRSMLGDLGRVLWDAGVQLIRGFTDGIRSKFNEVMGTLRSLTNLIPGWKGPVEVDAKLLTGNGRLIIGSLVDGFRQEEPRVQSYLNDLTRFIGGFGPDQPNLAAASPAASSESRPRPVKLGSDGTAMGDALLQLVINAIRRAGGDPAVLGV